MDQPPSCPPIHHMKDGRIQVDLTLPVDLPSGVTSCRMTVLIAPDDLCTLAAVATDEHRHKLGEALYWQCFLAETILRGQHAPLPAPLQRARGDATVKHGARIMA